MNISETITHETVFSAADDTIFIRGKIMVLDPAAYLMPLLSSAFAQAAGKRQIIIDVTQLEFINSSGIGCLLKTLRLKDAALEVVVRLSNNPWQKQSLDILRLIDPKTIRIE